MLTLEPARTDQHYDALLELVYNQRTVYLDAKLDLIELTAEQFGSYFRRTGKVFRICLDGKLVGLCWVVEDQAALTILGILIVPEYQDQGLGTQALSWVEAHMKGTMQAIKLQVHRSNPRARSLYERMGYQETNYNVETGFYTMTRVL